MDDICDKLAQKTGLPKQAWIEFFELDEDSQLDILAMLDSPFDLAYLKHVKDTGEFPV